MLNFLQSLIPWFISHGIKIILILIIAYLINRLGGKVIERAIRKGVRDTTKEATGKRQNTLIGVFVGALKVIVWLVAIMMILPELGINVGPILAGAGILGVALGFGAQYMIRDFLAGLFIIIENQYREGDVVCLDGTCGLVEDINLRKTILRDLDGIVHHVPNGEIKKASNLSKQFARVNLNIGISYKENLDKVIGVINKVGKELAEDPQWKDLILKPPQFLRVDDFGESAMIIKILGETKPLKQWDVTGELRKRIKTTFDKEGIEIPFRQITIHQAKD
ncbi:mechanosensitive ion channel family protein [bacterium]|uniref:Mechanosensitive ion channel family protein n=3 Tax=Candidatus Nealsoniibacteriota TaxID=1817911 RepID=A0A2M7EBC5_9BACT|nr:mechanosensitive ion channel family protein [bacterium]PIV65037.1 MAG: mechanosensitive ion channel family protein [Candidatus Nealsonbacteria bacterium CG01_land_8_20_14_3_00_12]PIW91488.1 MAG: mechanosensitive ion channel family protein [Candidatus Nealsonbacteria bacterium CG_4_8_14_3_um_filter_37_36]PJA82633.1 MAG: mechanosensitive ion channel family protein [Candidatus Nealsonbacteria bacterium CG_4_9_14_3_um_filter_37_29]